MSSPELKPAIIDFRMRLGLLMRKASIQRCEAISQRRKNPPTKAMRTSAIQIRRLEMKPLRSTAALRSLVVASIVMMLMGIDIQLFRSDVPEPAVGFVEAFLAVNLENIARPLHRHLDDVLHARGAMRHNDHAVGERDRLHQIVGYEQDRLALLLPDFQSLAVQHRARPRGERPEGLVHENHRRLVGERADDRGALAHAAGELRRIIFLETRKAGERDKVVQLPLALLARIALRVEAEGDVFLEREPREKLALLRHVADSGVELSHFLSLIENPSAGDRRQAGDEFEQRRFAAAGRPYNRNKFAVGDVQADIFQRDQVAALGSLERFGDLFDAYDEIVPAGAGAVAGRFHEWRAFSIMEYDVSILRDFGSFAMNNSSAALMNRAASARPGRLRIRRNW